MDFITFQRLLSSLSSSSSSSSSAAAELPIQSLLLALLCPLSVMILSLYLKLNIAQKILISVTRTIVQLLFAGYLLLGFIFELRNPYIVLLYLLLMAIIASNEVITRQSKVYESQFQDAFSGVLCGGLFIGVIGTIIVFNPNPYWEPHILIPCCGMLIGNSISGPSLAIEKILSDVSDKAYECETRLAFGATSYESILPSIRNALLQALTPNLNMMAVVGVVSIPGMMTGQLLGGASPLTAATYQMAILWLICGVATTSTLTVINLALKNAVFDNSHRLTIHRIIKKNKKIDGIDTKIILMIKNLFQYIKIRILNFNQDNNLSSSSSSSSQQQYELVKNTENIESLDLENNNNSSDIKNIEIEIDKDKIPTPISTPERKRNVKEINFKVTYDFKTILSNPTNEEPFFKVKNLNVKSGDKLLFNEDGISFSLKRGERVCIEGPSGIGKTRLLRAIAKLDASQSGTISFMGSIDSASIPKWRSRCMYIPQALPPLENTPKCLIREVCDFNSRRKRKGTIQLLQNFDELCSNAANSVGLEGETMDKQWRDLSGGERQRAIIACAILLVKSATVSSVEEEPLHSILLLDEPTAACDKESSALVEAAIIESNVTVLMITHDDRQSRRFCHRRLILSPTTGSPFVSPSRKVIKESKI